ncbi:hypothetical protein U14_03161 [Candidatus Moduliflexus flocculans]|uniref:Glycosyltransferase RgtA/B/C/D-like domain-containing protein n=1 Tax=Candidatus Moduliflexus flocculans TaxID=1499966 RepID=A0A081BNE9_9BACT|nr:hypothetical protein U14_03161 [Candidatus Moduliflexus flocculans]
MHILRAQYRALLVLLVVNGGFYAATFREGHDWGGDFSLYIHHAKNLVEGIPYKDIGYIYNPKNATVGPETFPPVFPLVLAPVYALFGLNLTAMKVELLFVFLIALWVLFKAFEAELSPAYALLLVAIIGFNPCFWEFKDHILSDIPFLLFVYLSLLTIHRAFHAEHSRRDNLLAGLLAGVLMYLAYGARSPGLVLIPSLWAYELLRRRRISRLTLSATIVFVCLMVVQGVLAHNDSSYGDQFASMTVETIFENVCKYAQRMAIFWDNGSFRLGRHALLLVTALLAFTGFVIRIRVKVTIFEVFGLFYTLLILLFPFSQLRYLFPLFPLYVAYMLRAIAACSRGIFRMPQKFIPIGAAMLMIAMTYFAQYSHAEYGAFTPGVTTSTAQELFVFITQQTPSDAVCIFRKPRVLALFTDRQSGMYHRPGSDQELLDYFTSLGVNYIITSPLDELFFTEFVQRHNVSWNVRFTNSDFTVYQIK